MREAGRKPGETWFRRLVRAAGRIRYRLLVVNLFVLLVPVAGLEFAHVYERQLLQALERDMRNQATLVRVLAEATLARGESVADGGIEALLFEAAKRTRTRIRLLDEGGATSADSHRHGPPEGREPNPPLLAPGARITELRGRLTTTDAVEETRVETRGEVKEALAGRRSTTTRVTRSGVFLFLAEPMRHAGRVRGAVYVTRSTSPVLFELHRIRSGLIVVLTCAICLGVIFTVILALTISRPIERLSRAARSIATGERGVTLPLGGGGELSELGAAFEEMTSRLEARQRYISEFAADVAHEFKSPLTSIRGAAELLAEGADDDAATRRRFLGNIELDAARLDSLVSRLLELSRIEASDQESQVFDLYALVERAVRRSQGPDGTIVLEYTASTQWFTGRESDLETALLNLLDNALRFSPPGGKVELSVADAPGSRLEIAVSDHGPGISPEQLPHIFERFYTTDRDREGTGLGLAIVKSVAVAHGGKVDVASAPGAGARFVISLPLAEGTLFQKRGPAVNAS
jgi:two-component system sensor histidine kinase ChvG